MVVTDHAAMVFHGTVVLLLGLIAGAPYGVAIGRGADLRTVEAWRTAHTGMCATGVMLLAMGAALRTWGRPGAAAHAAVWTLAGGSYAIAVAMTLAAATGARGMHAGGSRANRLVFIAYQLGVAATFVGVATFLWLAWRHY